MCRDSNLPTLIFFGFVAMVLGFAWLGWTVVHLSDSLTKQMGLGFDHVASALKLWQN